MLSDVAQFILDEILNHAERTNHRQGHSGAVFERAIAEIRAECLQRRTRVVLTSVGTHIIGVIKVIRAHTGLGLKESKDIVDQCQPPRRNCTGHITDRGGPYPINIPGDFAVNAAERLHAELLGAGATARIENA